MKSKKKLKIALVSLQYETTREPPSGLVYIATYLRDIVGLEESNIRVLESNYSNVSEELKKFSPDIIGFTAMSVEYGKVMKFAKEIKNTFHVPFILGGVHISTLPISLDNVFDIGVIGEGELTMEELVNLYLKKGEFVKKNLKKIKGIIFFDNNKIITTEPRLPIKNLDDLPIPDYHFVNKNYFRRQEIPPVMGVGVKCYLLTSRGCPYKCIFCSATRFWSNIRLHSADYIARVAKKQIDEFGADHLRIMDDLFAINPERLKEFKKAFEKYGILDKIKTAECHARANLMTEELCKALKDMKIKTLNFGFESGSDKVLSWLKCDTVSLKMNQNAILLAKKYNLSVNGSLVYGSPGETIEDMKKTNEFIDFAIKNKAQNIWSFVLTPLPNTPLWDLALKEGKVRNDDKMDWSLLSLDNPFFLDKSIDPKEFQKIFLEGRRKLGRLKAKLAIKFVIKNYGFAMKILIEEPKYQITRAYKHIFKK